MKDFAHSAAVFAAAFGTTPPSCGDFPGGVYAYHPAFYHLSDAIRAVILSKVRKSKEYRFKGSKVYWRDWCDQAAGDVLREIVLQDLELVYEGCDANELREWLEDAEANALPDCPGYNRSVIRAALSLIDNTPPSHCSRLLAAWQAVRDCPPPDINLMRDDAPEWGMDWGHKNAG